MLNFTGSAYSIKPSEPDDYLLLYKDLRRDDYLELTKASKLKVKTCLHLSYSVSEECYSAFDSQGHLLCMFGITPVKSKGIKQGVIWLLATTHIEKFPINFGKASKKLLTYFKEKYNLLYNRVDAANELHVKWLQWLGAAFLHEEDVNGYKFYRFVILGTNKDLS